MSDLISGLLSGVEILTRGEDGAKKWVAPNFGKYPVGHVDTFMNRYTSLAKVYRDYDESLLDSRDNARYMLNDVGVRECLDARRRMVSLLNWHLEPENDSSQSEREFCQLMEKTIRRIKHFQEYRYCAQYAIWFGKYGMQHRWRAEVINNSSIWMPKGIHQDDPGWRPLHGDKIVFRQLRPNMVPGAYEGQMGIRVGWLSHQSGDVINNRWRVESTDYGLAYFLSPSERRLVLVHKHHLEDAAYEDGLRAGSIHGVGIRSVIYWEWKQAKETMAYLMEFLERMAGGIQIWKYPQGNQQALAEMRQAAENYNAGQEHVMLVPVPAVSDGNQFGIDVIEPGFQGIEALQSIIKDYFGDRTKRYILGQKLSSEAEATGMGSGVAELHLDTLLQIIRSDATAHEQTMTSELVETLIKINVDKGVWADPGFVPRFVCETEEPDIDKKLEAVISLMDRGLKFRSKDLYELVGMAMPGPDDEVNPDPPEKGGEANGKPPETKMEKGTDVSGQADELRPDHNDAQTVGDDHMQRYERTIAERYSKSYQRSAITGLIPNGKAHKLEPSIKSSTRS